MQDVDNRRNLCVWGGVEKEYENSILSIQISCKPKTALKIKFIYLKQKTDNSFFMGAKVLNSLICKRRHRMAHMYMKKCLE